MENIEEIKNPQEDWRLQKIEIEFQRWGENKGKYEGKISFANGEYESFSFKIRPEMAQPYIDVMASDIVKSAESLGSRLIKSLGLKK
jgi:hypothetical protein